MTFTFPCGSTTTLDPYSELQTLEKTNSHNYGKYTSAAYNNELSQARKNAATRSVYFSHLLKAQE
ncbi:hypothetical protein ACXO18_06980, partial [Lactobacillus delbrueckii subsp. bulgaricus]